MRKSFWVVAIGFFLFLISMVFLQGLEVLQPEELSDDAICDLIYDYFGEDVKRADDFVIDDVVDLTVIINNIYDAPVSNEKVFSFVVGFEEKCVGRGVSGDVKVRNLFQGAFLGSDELNIAYLITSGIVVFILIVVLLYFLLRKQKG